MVFFFRVFAGRDLRKGSFGTEFCVCVAAVVAASGGAEVAQLIEEQLRLLGR